MSGATCIVLTTVPNREVADAIATALVSEHLAACVNVLPPMTSVYRWQGKVERADEIQLIVKTAESRFAAVAARLRALHPYDTPEVLMLRADMGADSYIAWIHRATGLNQTGP